jgi:diguanylate cyclase
MGITASPFLNPIAAEPEFARARTTARDLSRRARQRRQIQAMIAASYLLDAFILSIYAHAGTVPVAIGPIYAGCGMLTVAIYLVLSETGSCSWCSTSARCGRRRGNRLWSGLRWRSASQRCFC